MFTDMIIELFLNNSVIFLPNPRLLKQDISNLSVIDGLQQKCTDWSSTQIHFLFDIFNTICLDDLILRSFLHIFAIIFLLTLQCCTLGIKRVNIHSTQI